MPRAIARSLLLCALFSALFSALTSALLLPAPARARDLFEEGDFRLELRTALKASFLFSHPFEADPILGAEPSGAGFFRLRFNLTANMGELLTAELAYEQRALVSSRGSSSALLPAQSAVAYRVEQLDWALIDDPAELLYRHEFDRANVSLHLPIGELTVGRQAIGLGRGVLFSAVDVFAPFSPAEVDREWRRGIDAAVFELRLPDMPELSVTAIGAFGDGFDQWAALARIQLQLGEVDGSLLFGELDGDRVTAGVLSAIVGDAEVHGELAVFETDGEGVSAPILPDMPGVVLKALVGASYVFDVGMGLTLIFEYHYSGFGVENIRQRPEILFHPAFQRRFLQGRSQILGQHVLALVANTSINEDLGIALSYLQSPVDGSGMIAPSLSWTASDAVTVVANLLLPWGEGPAGGLPRSEWGSSPFTVFAQVRVYD